MHYQIDIREGLLQVSAGGALDTVLARKVVGEVVAGCRSHGLSRVLVDARGLDPAVSVAERFEIGRTLAENLPPGVRVAVLVSPEQMVHKTLEDAATNRGLAVRTTADPAEAYGFLGLAPAP
jgi:hypothetical protein